MNFKMFNKFKALLLAGAMLVGVVACSDYDDDIAGLSDRIESLEDGATVTVDDLATQLAAIELTIDDLAQLTETVEGVMEDVEGVDGDVSDLTTSIEADLAALEAELKAYVDGEITSLSETIEGIYATIESLNIVAARVAVLEAYCTGLGETTIASELAALQAQFDALDNTVASWTGEDMLTYISANGYVTKDQVLDLGYITSEDFATLAAGFLTETQIQALIDAGNYTTLEAVEAVGYLKSDALVGLYDEEALSTYLTENLSSYLTAYSTSAEVLADINDAISEFITDDALEGLYDEDALSAYLSDKEYTTVDDVVAEIEKYFSESGEVDLSEYVTSEQFEAFKLTVADCVNSTYVEDYVKKYVAGELDGYATSTWVEDILEDALLSYYTSAQVDAEITEALSDYATISYVNNFVVKYDAINVDIYEKIEEVAAALATYKTTVAVKFVEVEADVDALEVEVSDLSSSLSSLESYIKTMANQIYVLQQEVLALQGDVEDLQGDVEDLQTATSNLQSLVQSMVYVPATLEDMNSVCFGKVGRFFWSNKTSFAYLPALVTDEVDQRLTLDVKFRMSPASALGEVTEDNYLDYISLLIEGELGLTRTTVDVSGEGAPFELTGYETINAETGEFYVTITMGARVYPGKDDETYAFALSVTDVTGTDYITDYIGIDPDYFDIYADELAYDDETPTKAGVADDERTILYTDTDNVEFFDDYDTYAKAEDGKYYLFSTLYDTSEYNVTFAKTSSSKYWPFSIYGVDGKDDNGAPYTGADGSSTNAYVKFANYYSIQIYNVAPPLIDDIFNTDGVKFTIKGVVADGTSSSYVMLNNTTGANTSIGILNIDNDPMYFHTENIGYEEYNASERILSWIYRAESYARVVDVSADPTEFYDGNSPEMTAQQFNATIGGSIPSASVLSMNLILYKWNDTKSAWEVYDETNFNEETISFTAESPVKDEAPSDQQTAEVTFTTLPETGTYMVVVDYFFWDRTKIVVEIPYITVDGEPTYNTSYSITETFTFENSDYAVAPEDEILAVDYAAAYYYIQYSYRPNGSSVAVTSTDRYTEGLTFERTYGYYDEQLNPNYRPNSGPNGGSNEPEYIYVWVEETVTMNAEEAYTYYLDLYNSNSNYTVVANDYVEEVKAVEYDAAVVAEYEVEFDFSEGNNYDATLDVAKVLWDDSWATAGYYDSYEEFQERILGVKPNNADVQVALTATTNSKVDGEAEFVYDGETGILTVLFTPEPSTDPDGYPFGSQRTLTFTVTSTDDLGETITLGKITAKVTLILPGEDVMERIGGYFVSNIEGNTGYNQTKAIAYLLETEEPNDTYLVADKNIEVYTLLDAADAYEIEYVITESFTDFYGEKPAIVDGELIWNEWNKLSLEITAKLYYYDYVTGKNERGETVSSVEKIYLEEYDKVFYVVLDDPIADFETVELTIDASEGDGYVYLASALTLVETVSGNSDNVFNATDLVESYRSAFGANVEYFYDHIVETEETGSNNQILLELRDAGLVVFTETSTSVLHEIEYVYKVVYTYTYGTRTTYVSVNLVP